MAQRYGRSGQRKQQQETAGRAGGKRDKWDKRSGGKQAGSSRRQRQESSAGSRTIVAAPVALGERVEADIVGIGHTGEGVGRTNGFTLFVPGALPGERVRAEVTGLKKQYGFARLLDVLEASEERQQAPCPVFDDCGGCQLQHLEYDAQLRVKRQQVVDNLERIGKLRVRRDDGEATGTKERTEGGESVGNVRNAGNAENEADAGEGTVIVHPTIGMAEPWRYRNKVQVPIGEKDGRTVSGFYATGSHEIVDAETCIIRTEIADQVVSMVKEIADELGQAAVAGGRQHPPAAGLRHVVVKTGFHTGEVMVVLVTGQADLVRPDVWSERLAASVPGLASLCWNRGNAETGGIMGPETVVLWGSDRITDTIGEVTFSISAHSFYQVNPIQTEVLYGKALEYAGLTGEETVIDAYCGVGTISLFLAGQAKRVYGVELIPEAIEDAKRNAAMNGVTNVQFEAGRAEEVIPAWREQGIHADVIVVDPPRSGCDPALLNTMIAMAPRRIVYVSCNPSTLARDLRILEDGGFRTVEVQPVDMFGHTGHVECCVSLIRI